MRGGDTMPGGTSQAQQRPPASAPPRRRGRASGRSAGPTAGAQALARRTRDRWSQAGYARRPGIRPAQVIGPRNGARLRTLVARGSVDEQAVAWACTRRCPSRFAGAERRLPAPAGAVAVLLPVGICCAELIAAAVAAWPLYYAIQGQLIRAGEAVCVPLAAAGYATVRCWLAGWRLRWVLAAATVTFAVAGWLWVIWLLTVGPSPGAQARPYAPGPLPQRIHPLLDSQDHPLSLAGLARHGQQGLCDDGLGGPRGAALTQRSAAGSPEPGPLAEGHDPARPLPRQANLAEVLGDLAARTGQPARPAAPAAKQDRTTKTNVRNSQQL